MVKLPSESKLNYFRLIVILLTLVPFELGRLGLGCQLYLHRVSASLEKAATWAAAYLLQPTELFHIPGLVQNCLDKTPTPLFIRIDDPV